MEAGSDFNSVWHTEIEFKADISDKLIKLVKWFHRVLSKEFKILYTLVFFRGVCCSRGLCSSGLLGGRICRLSSCLLS